jgi:hypothetical protein
VQIKEFNKVPLLIEVGTSDPHISKLHFKEFVDAAHYADLKTEFKIRE